MKAKNIILLRVGDRALTRAHNKALKEKYRYICTIQHPNKKGTKPLFSLVATKKWWSEDLRKLLRQPKVRKK